MSKGAAKASEYVRRRVTLPIERIGDTGWLDLAELRRFVEEAERLDLTGHNVRVWWTRGPEDEEPRLEVTSQTKVEHVARAAGHVDTAVTS